MWSCVCMWGGCMYSCVCTSTPVSLLCASSSYKSTMMLLLMAAVAHYGCIHTSCCCRSYTHTPPGCWRTLNLYSPGGSCASYTYRLPSTRCMDGAACGSHLPSNAVSPTTSSCSASVKSSRTRMRVGMERVRPKPGQLNPPHDVPEDVRLPKDGHQPRC